MSRTSHHPDGPPAGERAPRDRPAPGDAARAPGDAARAPGDADGAPGSEPPARYSWSDILAMTIAAYQVLLPGVLLVLGAMVAVYLLLRLMAR